MEEDNRSRETESITRSTPLFPNCYRQHDWADGTPHASREDHGTVLNNLDLQTLSLGHDEGGGNAGAGSSVLRKSMLVGNTDVEVERPLQSVSEGLLSDPHRYRTRCMLLQAK